MLQRLLVASALILALLLPFAGTAEADYSYYPPEPNNIALQVTTPIFSQQIAVGSNTAVTCTLDFQGQSVAMPFTPSQSACVYQWPAPLPPGSYEGTITVTAPGFYPLSEPFQFSIAQNALQSLPPESLTSIETLRILNYVRKQEGLGAVSLDPALQAASQAHSDYYIANSALYLPTVSLHSEPDPAAKGYTSNSPSDRDAAFGAVGGGNEVMATGTLTPAWSLVGLFETTFHRFALLDPTLAYAGGGYAQSPLGAKNPTEAFVADMTDVFSGSQPLAVEFPWQGAQHVPVSFLGEYPDPLAGIAPRSVTSGTTEPESGYPISVTFDASRVSQVTVTQATLTAQDGTEVPSYLVDGQNYKDQNAVYSGESMGTSVAIFPKAALAYGQTYTADIQGTLAMKTGGPQPFDEKWSFTTAGKPAVSKVFEDGGYLFVAGDNLENSYVSSYEWSKGQASVGTAVYGGAYYLASPVSGQLTNVQITDAATGITVGKFQVSKAPFTDSGASAAFQYAVDAANAQGLVLGYPDGTFRPDASISDAQAIVMLYRAMGKPALPQGTAIPPGSPSWAKDAIAWAQAQGVVQPTDGFGPYLAATRGQLATWLLRAFGVQASKTPSTFKDASQIPAQYQGYVSAAAQDGIVLGYPDGTFRPQDPVSRGAFAIWTLRLSDALQAPQNLF